MPPIRVSRGSPAEARNRRLIAAKYLEVAELAASEEGPVANNVVVGVCVLAGIAAADTVCLLATGARYSGTDHAEAATYLAQVDPKLGNQLQTLVRLKPLAHYGTGFVSDPDRTRAVRAAQALLDAAARRST